MVSYGSMSFFRRINDQFNEAKGWKQHLFLISFYGVGLAILTIAVLHFGEWWREFGKPFDRWLASFF